MGQGHLDAVHALMERHANLPMDLADASLIVAATELGEGVRVAGRTREGQARAESGLGATICDDEARAVSDSRPTSEFPALNLGYRRHPSGAGRNGRHRSVSSWAGAVSRGELR